jgi:transcriptional regulator with XRE-family HTH domain
MPKRADKSVADLMREWREVAGLSRAEAADLLGLSPNAIRDIEQGLRRAGDKLTMFALEKLIEDAK